MSWIYLGIAAVFEIVFAMSMKYSNGFTNLWAGAITIVSLAGLMYFLSLAMKELPVSVAYPIWTAAGVLGTVILGYLLLDESLGVLKVVSMLAIVGGVAGLRATMS